MSIRETVRILTVFAQDDGETLAQHNGTEAATLAEDMISLLRVRLREETPYKSLWESFQADPEATATELIGALEVLAEADPALQTRLEAFLEEYHDTQPPSGPRRVQVPERDIAVKGRTAETNVGADETAVTVAEEEDYGEGAYLYGNLEPGTPRPQPEPGFEGLGFRGQVIRPGQEEADLALLFEQLKTTVDAASALTEETREDLKSRLGAIEAALNAEKIDEESAARHMRAVRRSAPDLEKAILTQLKDSALGLEAAMERIARRI
jgi:hypothetical protein